MRVNFFNRGRALIESHVVLFFFPFSPGHRHLRKTLFSPSTSKKKKTPPPPPPVSSATDNNKTTTAIVPDRARYHVFEMDGVDFLVGTAGDGRLDVRDAFVCDSASARASRAPFDGESGGAPGPSYSRAEGSGSPDLPQQPLPFVAVPWELRFEGDSLYKKPAWSKLLKVYLIAAARTEPSLRLDLTQVVSLDAATRSVRREEVVNRATCDDPQYTTLRIR